MQHRTSVQGAERGQMSSFMSSQIKLSVVEAYRRTEYLVEASEPFVLLIGQASAALSRLHQQSEVSSSAFITACNPRSCLLSAEQNSERQQCLFQDIVCAGWGSVKGRGQAISGSWPPEDSFLVLGIGRQEACRLARAYDQNALVFCGSDCVPELVLLR